jgi:hypothetical protein
VFKQIILLIVFLLSPFLLFHLIDANKIYSQSDEPSITPVIQWTSDLEGTFSYCVYEGTVTLDSVNDPQAFCIVPDETSSFEGMQVSANDDTDEYELVGQILPEDMFEYGALYSVCVVFAPFSPQDAGYDIAERCQTFNFEDNNLSEEPLINLDEGILFVEDGTSVDDEEIKPTAKPGVPSTNLSDNKEIKDSAIPVLSKNNISDLTTNEKDKVPTQINKTNEENMTTSHLPSTGITGQF